MTSPPRLLIIDPHLVRRSPAMKSLIPLLPQLLDEGWIISVWSVEMDAIDPRIAWERVPCPFRRWALVSTWFWLYAHGRYLWQFRGAAGAARRSRILVQATSYYCRWADIIGIHFVFSLYEKVAQQFKRELNLSLYERAMLHLAVWKEKLLFRPCGHARVWTVVSRRLMEEMAPYLPAGDRRVLLPNAYNPERFNHQVRLARREKMRQELGIGAAEVVFAFVCLGGFNRKGFALALEACYLLHGRGCPCRLLVIGGRDEHPPDVGPWLERLGLEPSQAGFVICRGRTPEVEGLLAGADALLFPSYCEAFSIAEIEAAALGLRLYLTPHYGSEMTLESGCSGSLLPWDAPGIAAVLEGEIRSGRIFIANESTGAALDPAAMAQRYRALLEAEWAAK